MTREEYKPYLLKNDFVFVKTQKGFPSRGEEDVYTHPKYKYNFYVTHYKKNDDLAYGFYTGKKNGKELDKICQRNVKDNFSGKELLMWADDAFIKLMTYETIGYANRL